MLEPMVLLGKDLSLRIFKRVRLELLRLVDIRLRISRVLIKLFCMRRLRLKKESSSWSRWNFAWETIMQVQIIWSKTFLIRIIMQLVQIEPIQIVLIYLLILHLLRRKFLLFINLSNILWISIRRSLWILIAKL